MKSRFLLPKLRAAERLLGETGIKFIKAIYPSETEDVEIQRMADAYYKWLTKEDPVTENHQFFDHLSDAIQFDGDATHLMTCDMEEFHRCIPETARLVLLQARGSTLPVEAGRLSRIHLDPHYNFDRLYEALERGFDQGHVDQRFLYMGPDSVRRWKGMISGGKYHTHDECLAAISALIASSDWKRLFHFGKFDAVVDLGAGTAIKARRVVDDFLSHTSRGKLHIAVVDTSLYMLDAAASNFLPLVREHPDRLTYDGYCADFCDLRGIAKEIRGEEGAIYLLLGSTFANTQERQLLKSLQRQTNPGDLFIVGVEFFDLSVEGSELERMLVQFKDDNLAALGLSAVRLLPKMHNLTGITSEVKPTVSAPGEFSDLLDVRAIKIELRFGGKEILVAFSNRYKDDTFQAFIESYGFSYLAEEVSPLNPRYKLKIFQRRDR